MKKFLLSLVALFLMAGTTHAQTVANEVAGNYTGKLAISLTSKEDLQFGEETYNVVLTADGNNTVTFALNNFGFSGMNLGDIVLPNIPVQKQTNGSILFGENAIKNFSFLDGAIVATAKINETSSIIKGDSLIADVDVIWKASEDMPIYVQFKGKKEATATGIQQAVTKNAANTIYDLQGRRLQKAPNKGLFILNGKKVIR